MANRLPDMPMLATDDYFEVDFINDANYSESVPSTYSLNRYESLISPTYMNQGLTPTTVITSPITTPASRLTEPPVNANHLSLQWTAISAPYQQGLGPIDDPYWYGQQSHNKTVATGYNQHTRGFQLQNILTETFFG